MSALPACPQDFPRIATFLPGRTVEEVIRLYYAIQVRQVARQYCGVLHCTAGFPDCLGVLGCALVLPGCPPHTPPLLAIPFPTSPPPPSCLLSFLPPRPAPPLPAPPLLAPPLPALLQRTDEFSQTCRKYLLRKRREQTESNKSLRGFGNFMGMHSLAADLEAVHQRQAGAEGGEAAGAGGPGGLGRSNSRGSGLSGVEVRAVLWRHGGGAQRIALLRRHGVWQHGHVLQLRCLCSEASLCVAPGCLSLPPSHTSPPSNVYSPPPSPARLPVSRRLLQRTGRNRARHVLVDATGPLAAAPIEFFGGAPPAVPVNPEPPVAAR